LDEEKILNKIEGAQKSKKEFVISDGGMELDFFHVKYPEGSGGNIKKHLLFGIFAILPLDKDFKKKKRAIGQIVNPWDCFACPVLLSSHISMLRNPKFPTQSGRRNG
jgi:hypothetical protein